MSKKAVEFEGKVFSRFSGNSRPEGSFVDNDSVYFYPGSEIADTFLGVLRNEYKTTKRPIVKIQHSNDKNRKVWRRLCCINCKNDEMYIDYDGKKTLLQRWDDNEDEFKLLVKKGCFIPYYWHHSNSAVRCSFRVGVVSIIISLVSLVLSLCQYYC